MNKETRRPFSDLGPNVIRVDFSISKSLKPLDRIIEGGSKNDSTPDFKDRKSKAKKLRKLVKKAVKHSAEDKIWFPTTNKDGTITKKHYAYNMVWIYTAGPSGYRLRREFKNIIPPGEQENVEALVSFGKRPEFKFEEWSTGNSKLPEVRNSFSNSEDAFAKIADLCAKIP